MDVLTKRIEKDFEQFIHLIAALEASGFFGLCKLLGVKMFENEDQMKESAQLKLEKKINEMTPEEKEVANKQVEKWIQKVKKDFPARQMEDILNDLMNQFLELPKRKRREIIQVLKDYKRGL